MIHTIQSAILPDCECSMHMPYRKPHGTMCNALCYTWPTDRERSSRSCLDVQLDAYTKILGGLLSANCLLAEAELQFSQPLLWLCN